MVSYTPTYAAWKDFPDESTPIIAAAMQGIDNALTQLVSSVNALDTEIASTVPNTRTINGHALNANITLSAADVGALPTSTTPASIGAVANAAGQTLTVWVGTAAAYAALATKDPSTIYFTT